MRAKPLDKLLDLPQGVFKKKENKKKTCAGHSLLLPGGSRPQYGRHIYPPQPGPKPMTA